MIRTLLCACFGVLFLAAASADAGTLVNLDSKEYKYVIWWEDLSPRESGTVKPGESVTFEDKPCLVELVGMNDNIYVKADGTVYIVNGVMRENKPR